MMWILSFGSVAFLFINAIGAAKNWAAGRPGWAGAYIASLICNVIFFVGLGS